MAVCTCQSRKSEITECLNKVQENLNQIREYLDVLQQRLHENREKLMEQKMQNIISPEMIINRENEINTLDEEIQKLKEMVKTLLEEQARIKEGQLMEEPQKQNKDTSTTKVVETNQNTNLKKVLNQTQEDTKKVNSSPEKQLHITEEDKHLKESDTEHDKTPFTTIIRVMTIDGKPSEPCKFLKKTVCNNTNKDCLSKSQKEKAKPCVNRPKPGNSSRKKPANKKPLDKNEGILLPPMHIKDYVELNDFICEEDPYLNGRTKYCC